MNYTLYPADKRGHVKIDWLESYHTFSFGEYYDPTNLNFGVLRVINDDIIAGGEGFGLHPHRDMEIITYVNSGSLEHTDSIGNKGVIKAGEIQAMSAGTGVAHSEYSTTPRGENTTLQQIWIIPDRMHARPSYSQKPIDQTSQIYPDSKLKQSYLLVSPDGRGGSLKINQNAFLSQINLTNKESLELNMNDNGLKVFIMVIKGSCEVSIKNNSDNPINLKQKDAIGIEPNQEISLLTSSEPATLLVFEIPEFEI